MFDFSAGVPIPVFPNEGITTRIAKASAPDAPLQIDLLETSSPGLRGQSGGPIVDREGTVWAIQSRTMHHQLGFTAQIEHDGRRTDEHQILNVGLGPDASTIKAFLDGVNVPYQTR